MSCKDNFSKEERVVCAQIMIAIRSIMSMSRACSSTSRLNDVDSFKINISDGITHYSREFTMAEIEYFVDPNDKSHAKFDSVGQLEVQLYSASNQMNGESARLVRLHDAVQSKLINNETLGYFIGRIYLFMTRVGIDKRRLRFRQHMSNEMAHYACDCWDAECQTSYGWVECVGCADRSCYDLNQHSKCSGERLVAERPLTESKKIEVNEVQAHSSIIGKSFGKDTAAITKHLQSLSHEEGKILHDRLEQG
jgi:glycyl-tRNA synthetase